MIKLITTISPRQLSNKFKKTNSYMKKKEMKIIENEIHQIIARNKTKGNRKIFRLKRKCPSKRYLKRKVST